jgi:hypothetical protein
MAFAFSVAPTAGVGTISIARNGMTVTGIGTNFQSPSLLGQIILVNGFNSRVTAVASGNSMTINRVPSCEITGEAFSFCASGTNINQSGVDTDPSGLSALLGVNTYRVGIQAVYDLGVLRLALTGSAAVFYYDANRHCIVWSNQVSAIELTIGSGRTLTITGARTDGTYTAPFYPRALAMPRVLPVGDSTYLPAHRSVLNSGTLNISGVWFDTNQVAELGGTANITECKWSATDQNSNYRMNSGGITINGMELYNMSLTLLASAAALNGMRFYNSGYTPVSLPSVAPSNPRIYTDWNFLGALPIMNNFSGNANYVEFRNFGDWAGFKLATNSAVNMAARFVKNVSVNVINTLGVGITDAIVYRLDTNNGSRVTYTADEHFIQSTVSGVATGRILALIGRLPTGAANNSTQYTAFMDCRNAANDQSGNDILRYVSYEHLLDKRPVNLKGTLTLFSEQTLLNDTNVTLTRTNAIAKLASSFTVDPITKILTVTANSTYDDLYDALKAYKATANAVNLATPTLDTLIVTPNGTSLEAYTGWSLVVNTGITLSRGTKFEKIIFNAITLIGTAQITGVYQDTTGTSTVLTISGFGANSAVYVEDNNAIQKYFNADVTGSVVIYIPPTATGSWYYAVEKYGNQRQSDFFTFSGGQKAIVVKAIEDTGISVTNSATVGAYTSLENPDKIYDYVAFLRLSEPHISYGQIVFKDGKSLDLQNASMLENQSATNVASFNYDTKLLTIKSLVLNTGITFDKIIATPPATITANTNEQINVLIEDANGDSSLTLLGGDNLGYKLWKVPSSSPVDVDPTSGVLLATLSNNTSAFRFIGISGFDIIGVDLSSGVKRRTSMVKGVYIQSFYVGNQIQLATDAPQLIENNQKLDELILKVDTNLDVAVSTRLADADYVEPATAQSVWEYETRTLTSAGAAGATLAEIEASTILAKEGTSQSIKTKVDTLSNYNDTALVAKIDAIKTVVDSIKTTVEDKTGYSLTTSQVELIAYTVESHLLNEGDNQMLINAIVGAIGNTNIDETVLVAAIRADLERVGGKLDVIEVSTNNIEMNVPSIIDQLDGKPTLAEIEASNVLAKEATTQAVKTKVDTLENPDFTDTNALIVDLGTPLQSEDYVAPDNAGIASVKAKVDQLENYNDGTLQGKIDAVKTKVDQLENFDGSALVNKVDSIIPKLGKINEGLQLISNFEPYDDEL